MINFFKKKNKNSGGSTNSSSNTTPSSSFFSSSSNTSSTSANNKLFTSISSPQIINNNSNNNNNNNNNYNNNNLNNPPPPPPYQLNKNKINNNQINNSSSENNIVNSQSCNLVNSKSNNTSSSGKSISSATSSSISGDGGDANGYNINTVSSRGSTSSPIQLIHPNIDSPNVGGGGGGAGGGGNNKSRIRIFGKNLSPSTSSSKDSGSGYAGGVGILSEKDIFPNGVKRQLKGVMLLGEGNDDVLIRARTYINQQGELHFTNEDLAQYMFPFDYDEDSQVPIQLKIPKIVPMSKHGLDSDSGSSSDDEGNNYHHSGINRFNHLNNKNFSNKTLLKARSCLSNWVPDSPIISSYRYQSESSNLGPIKHSQIINNNKDFKEFAIESPNSTLSTTDLLSNQFSQQLQQPQNNHKNEEDNEESIKFENQENVKTEDIEKIDKIRVSFGENETFDDISDVGFSPIPDNNIIKINKSNESNKSNNGCGSGGGSGSNIFSIQSPSLRNGFTISENLNNQSPKQTTIQSIVSTTTTTTTTTTSTAGTNNSNSNTTNNSIKSPSTQFSIYDFVKPQSQPELSGNKKQSYHQKILFTSSPAANSISQNISPMITPISSPIAPILKNRNNFNNNIGNGNKISKLLISENNNSQNVTPKLKSFKNKLDSELLQSLEALIDSPQNVSNSNIDNCFGTDSPRLLLLLEEQRQQEQLLKLKEQENFKKQHQQLLEKVSSGLETLRISIQDLKFLDLINEFNLNDHQNIIEFQKNKIEQKQQLQQQNNEILQQQQIVNTNIINEEIIDKDEKELDTNDVSSLSSLLLSPSSSSTLLFSPCSSNSNLIEDHPFDIYSPPLSLSTTKQQNQQQSISTKSQSITIEKNNSTHHLFNNSFINLINNQQ
ncbi:hypothetical protein ACTFIW_007346 [Dictyostelium discoideum]